MNPTTANPNDVINQMIALRYQLAQLEHQIAALKPAFFEACTAQNVTQFEHEQALIFRKLTPGKWNYPSDILEQEHRLKQLKEQFQQTHEPMAGREITWLIKLKPQS